MLDGQSKAAMGITAYVVIVLARACESVPRGGAKTLADVHCCAGAQAKLPDLLMMFANCAKARSVSVYDGCRARYAR